MGRILLSSILLSVVLVPYLAARDRLPRRAWKRLLVYALLAHMTYAFLVLVVYPRT